MPDTTQTPGWDLKNLVAWQVAIEFAEAVYRSTKSFPRDETLGLRLQLRRSAVSVASNIAEGHGRSSKREYARYLLISRGSLKEAETQVVIASRLGYFGHDQATQLLALAARINKLITGLRKRLNASQTRPDPILHFPFSILAVHHKRRPAINRAPL